MRGPRKDPLSIFLSALEFGLLQMKEAPILQKHLAGTLCSYSKNEGKETQSSTCRWSRTKSRISYLSGMIGLQMRSSRDRKCHGMITQVRPANETLSFLAHFSGQLPQKIVKQNRIFCNLGHLVFHRKVWGTLQKRVKRLKSTNCSKRSFYFWWL